MYLTIETHRHWESLSMISSQNPFAKNLHVSDLYISNPFSGWCPPSGLHFCNWKPARQCLCVSLCNTRSSHQIPFAVLLCCFWSFSLLFDKIKKDALKRYCDEIFTTKKKYCWYHAWKNAIHSFLLALLCFRSSFLSNPPQTSRWFSSPTPHLNDGTKKTPPLFFWLFFSFTLLFFRRSFLFSLALSSLTHLKHYIDFLHLPCILMGGRRRHLLFFFGTSFLSLFFLFLSSLFFL